jgi:hypothetical protein
MKSHGLMLQVLTPTLTLAVEGMPTSTPSFPFTFSFSWYPDTPEHEQILETFKTRTSPWGHPLSSRD